MFAGKAWDGVSTKGGEPGHEGQECHLEGILRWQGKHGLFRRECEQLERVTEGQESVLPLWQEGGW